MEGLTKFYLKQDEELRGTFLALRDLILKHDNIITHELKYGMPFFCFKGKMFCYLWFHKKHKQPYIGIVEGGLFNEPFLIQEKRSRMKIMLIDQSKDLPVDEIKMVLDRALDFYRK